jgi:hypothetical protein
MAEYHGETYKSLSQIARLIFWVAAGRKETSQGSLRRDWKDAKGNLWLFGGYNYGSSNSYFNDLFWPLNSRKVARG